MRSLVVCPDDFKDVYSRCLHNGRVSLNDTIINYALIESDAPEFDPDLYPDHVIVKKTAFSCNYREISCMINASEKVSKEKNQVKYYSIGSEFVASVIGVGRNVCDLKINDRVIPNGEYPFTSSKSVPAGLPTNHASREIEILLAEKLLKIPEELIDSVASGFTIGAQTTYAMIEKLNIQPGKKVLITGITSNTSLFALNALKNLDVYIFGISRSSRHLEKLYDLGLKHVFVMPDKVESLLELKEIREFVAKYGGFDYVIDPFADVYLFKVLEAMNLCGKYISCGIADQFGVDSQLIKMNLKLAKVIQSNLSIFGSCLGTTDNLSTAVEDYAAGRLNVVIDSVIVNNIHAFIEQSFVSKDRFGKVIYSYD